MKGFWRREEYLALTQDIPADRDSLVVFKAGGPE